MEIRVFEEVLRDQKEDFQLLVKKNFVSRREEEQVDLNSPLAQVVIGVRRSGKSTLCCNVLKKSGLSFAYVNFDDERLYGLSGAELNDVLSVLYKIYGDFECLFIDEIQNISEWFLFVNRLLRREMKILITGSNAKLLSGELATHLTGRHNKIELFPFSFQEYCDLFNIDKDSKTTKEIAFRREAFDNYLKTGGFPELLKCRVPKNYIDTLMKNIIETDIRQRYRIKYMSTLSKIAWHLMNIAPTVVNYCDLQDIFAVKSLHTVENYAAYCKNAYIFAGLQKYSAKSRQRITNEKFYCIDVAMMNGRENAFSGENLGWRLESIVFIELLRRCKSQMQDVYYYSDRSCEIDFVVCERNKVVSLYQVSYDISAAKTRKREISALLQGARKLNCSDLYLITDHEFGDIEANGITIKMRPAFDWVLEYTQNR